MVDKCGYCNGTGIHLAFYGPERCDHSKPQPIDEAECDYILCSDTCVCPCERCFCWHQGYVERDTMPDGRPAGCFTPSAGKVSAVYDKIAVPQCGEYHLGTGQRCGRNQGHPVEKYHAYQQAGFWVPIGAKLVGNQWDSPEALLLVPDLVTDEDSDPTSQSPEADLREEDRPRLGCLPSNRR